MIFWLFDRDETFIGAINDILNCKHTEELNGEIYLEMTTLHNISKGQRIVYRDSYKEWHEFIVKGVEEDRDDSLIKEIYAEHSIYETVGDYVDDKRPYNVAANIALADALLTTRWEVGQVDDLGINSTNFYHISAMEAIQKVADIWEGELRFRIEVSGSKVVNRYVDLLDGRGEDTGKRFTYGKDLIQITRKIHEADVPTALYGYGKGEEIEGEDGDPTGGYGRRITFKEINDGKAYVEDLDALEIWGRPQPDGTKAHVFRKVEFDDCEDPEELLELTLKELEKAVVPKITYTAKVEDLYSLGFIHEGVRLGDICGIIDTEFQPTLRLKSKVIKMEVFPLGESDNILTFGTFIPAIQDKLAEGFDYISSFRSKQGVWDRSRIIDTDNTINTQYLDGVIDILKNRLISSQSGWYTDTNGNIVLDALDGSSSMMLSGQGFMIANTKKSNGDWDYRTFGTGEGFLADVFIGGLLKGGKVKFDLTNGTLLIGNSTEDYSLLFDGHSLKLNFGGKLLDERLDEIEENIEDIEVGGRNLLRNSEVEKTSSREYVMYANIAPIFDEYGVGTYTFSFDLKTEIEGTTRVYYTDREAGDIKYKFTPEKEFNTTPEYKRYSMTVDVDILTETATHTSLAFYGTYETGAIPSVKNVKIEKGNKATDWTPAPEDVAQNIVDSQEYVIGQLNETEEKLDNVIGLVGDESIVSIKEQLESSFESELAAIRTALYGEEGDETESILSRLSELGSDTAAMYTNLGEQTALIETLTGKISIEGDSILIGDAQASKGIRITPDEIAFLEGESKVAWITGGLLYIDAGVFLTRLKIGNHVFQSVDGNPNITIVGYEP